ncbi:hypothetical protein GBA52_025970 [Prunus armeniaca]|nr:hypothetical protein GBA52_025970 [Prunus armeniaca]
MEDGGGSSLAYTIPASALEYLLPLHPLLSSLHLLLGVVWQMAVVAQRWQVSVLPHHQLVW